MSKIEKIISIGASCDSMFFCNQLNLRTKGPVDNMIGHFKYVYKLFNNDFLKSIINNNYSFSNTNIYDDYKLCQFDGYQMVHNNFRLKKTKNELLNRIQVFNEYCKEASKNNNYFFVYSTIYNDRYLIKSDIINTFIMLPDYVKKRLLFVNGRMSEKNFNEIFNINYPVFTYNTELLRNPENKQIVITMFFEFWKENKHIYENLNNCKYDDFEIQNEESN